MTRATYSATPLLRSVVHRPQGVILVSYSWFYYQNFTCEGQETNTCTCVHILFPMCSSSSCLLNFILAKNFVLWFAAISFLFSLNANNWDLSTYIFSVCMSFVICYFTFPWCFFAPSFFFFLTQVLDQRPISQSQKVYNYKDNLCNYKDF